MQFKQLNHALVIALFTSAGLLAGTAHALSPTPMTTPIPSYPSWDSTSVYTAGQRVSYNGTFYEAKWWTQGDNPAQSGEWGAWKLVTGLQVTPTPTPTTTPSTLVTEPLTTSRPNMGGTCANPSPASWQTGQQIAAGQVVSVAGYMPGNGSMLVFKAVAAHLSSEQNKPVITSTSVTYDSSLWQTGAWYIPPCPTISPTPVPTPTATPSNQPPSVSISSIYAAINNDIRFNATASDSDGSITKVEFYVDNSLVATKDSSPYQVSQRHSYFLGSTHTGYAVATDNLGAQTTSSTITFTIASDVPPPNCVDAAWNSATAYTGGQKVSYNGRTYQAQWWTQGEQPDLNTGSGKPWKDLGACYAPPPTPTPTPTPTATPFTATPTPLVCPMVTPPGPGSVWVSQGDCAGYWTTPPTPTPTASSKPVLESAQITTWKNGAKGAYSLVHDDYCSMYYGNDPYIKIIDPELKKRGLVAGFGVITNNCSEQHWTAAKQFIANGHEIVSHSRNHPDPYVSDADLEAQLNGSAADIAAKLEGYQASYFIWPSDAASTVATDFLKNNTQYLGGRASHLVANGTVDYTTMPAGVNAANFDNPFRVKWDLFTTDGRWSLYPMGSEILNLHIDAAISQGGWATRTAHGVDTGYWETIPLARYQAHLDYAKAKVDSGELWMDTPSNVIKYRYARENCRLLVPAVIGNNTIGFSSTTTCQKYATPLTLQITASNVQGTLAIMQNGQALPLKTGPMGSVLVTADPRAGNLTLVNTQ
ncbi:carbohydrate-binding protein [Chitinibacter sp. S2-10]|uniref:carbohydrate-binding protein n=1 Tax=Chitinibacter sp. S2-10 TaxID=3373597 RepID=UPI003977894E